MSLSCTNTENFSISAPSTFGTYDLQLKAYSDDSCNSGGSSTFELNDAIIVQQPSVENPTLGSSCGLDMVLVMDTSSSISGGELFQMKTAFNNFVSAFVGTPTQISVVSFDDVAQLQSGFTGDLGSLTGVINGIFGSGYTNWEDALSLSHSLFPNRSNPDVIVFTSDGNPTDSSAGGPDLSQPNAHLAPSINQANLAKTDGIRIITLGIGSDVDQANLEAISSADAYYNSSDFGTLATTLSGLASELCGGTITVTKLVDGQIAPEWHFSVVVQDGTPSPSEGDTDSNGQINFDINPSDGVATADVVEDLPEGYSLESVSCTKNNEPIEVSSDTDSVNGLEIGVNDIFACTFNNTERTSSIYGAKWEDLDGNGKWDEEENGIEGWTIELYQGEFLVDTQTNSDGNYLFENLTAGEYQVCEVPQAGYERTFPTDSNCQDVTLETGESTEGVNFGNKLLQVVELGLLLTKTNDAVNPLSTGGTVTYTLVVTNNGNQALSNVQIKDVLPGGFTYVAGSSTFDGSSTSDPSNNSGVLTWTVGILGVEQSVTLEYQATVGSDVASGDYTNIAVATGQLGFIERFFALAEEQDESDPVESELVDSTVTVLVSSDITQTLSGQVLGASTELPASGSPTVFILELFALIVLGGAFKVAALKLEKRNNKKHV